MRPVNKIMYCKAELRVNAKEKVHHKYGVSLARDMERPRQPRRRSFPNCHPATSGSPPSALTTGPRAGRGSTTQVGRFDSEVCFYWGVRHIACELGGVPGCNAAEGTCGGDGVRLPVGVLVASHCVLGVVVGSGGVLFTPTKGMGYSCRRACGLCFGCGGCSHRPF
jgi:hypothetical protein